jgi:hypothetical protein
LVHSLQRRNEKQNKNDENRDHDNKFVPRERRCSPSRCQGVLFSS